MVLRRAQARQQGHNRQARNPLVQQGQDNRPVHGLHLIDHQADRARPAYHLCQCLEGHRRGCSRLSPRPTDLGQTPSADRSFAGLRPARCFLQGRVQGLEDRPPHPRSRGHSNAQAPPGGCQQENRSGHGHGRFLPARPSAAAMPSAGRSCPPPARLGIGVLHSLPLGLGGPGPRPRCRASRSRRSRHHAR